MSTAEEELLIELLDRALCSEKLDDYVDTLEAIRQVIDRVGRAPRGWSR